MEVVVLQIIEIQIQNAYNFLIDATMKPLFIVLTKEKSHTRVDFIAKNRYLISRNRVSRDALLENSENSQINSRARIRFSRADKISH